MIIKKCVLICFCRWSKWQVRLLSSQVLLSLLVLVSLVACSRIERVERQKATTQMVQALLPLEKVTAIKPGNSWRTYGPDTWWEKEPTYSLPPDASRYASVDYQEESTLPTISIEHIVMQYIDAEAAQAAFAHVQEKNIVYEIRPESTVTLFNLNEAPRLAADAIYFRCEKWAVDTDDLRLCTARMRYGRYFTQVIAQIAPSGNRAFTQEEFYHLLQVVDTQMVELSQQ